MGLQSWKALRSYGNGGLGARLTVASVTVALVMIPFMLFSSWPSCRSTRWTRGWPGTSTSTRWPIPA